MFISHAGAQKQTIAASLQAELHRCGVSAFLDETSLHPGDAADVEMEAALRSCSIVVVVLTPDYLRSSYCMAELHWALHPEQPHPPLLHKSTGLATRRAAAGTATRQPEERLQSTTQRSKEPPALLPVFYHTSDVDGLQQEMQRQVADARRRSALVAEQKRLQQASTDLAALCRITGIPSGLAWQVSGSGADVVTSGQQSRIAM